MEANLRTALIATAIKFRTVTAKVLNGPDTDRVARMLFEHVEHIVHGRTSCDGPHLGADVAIHFRNHNNLSEAAFAMLVAIEWSRFGRFDDARTMLTHAEDLIPAAA